MLYSGLNKPFAATFSTILSLKIDCSGRRKIGEGAYDEAREDLSDTTLSPEDREDLLFTHQLLMNQKKKLQQTLFSTS